MSQTRRRSELEALKRRFLVLAEVDQLDFWRWVGEQLRVERRAFDDELVRRHETLDCIRRAAAHLRLARSPKVAEYEAAQKALELPWSWQRIHRLWGSFAVAADVAFGAKAPASQQERGFMSRHGGVSPSEREEYFTAVRRWLDTNPPVRSAAAYDAYARAYNYRLAGDRLPLPRRLTIVNALALSWRDVVAVAAGETTHPAAVRTRLEKRDWSRGRDDLVGSGTIALLIGAGRERAIRLGENADFPRPALVLGHRRGWLRDEVESYLRGERRPLLPANRLREQYLTAAEVTAATGLHPKTLVRDRHALRPAGMVAGISYWLRDEVDAYVAANRTDVGRRRAERAKPGTVASGRRQSRFVTKMSLARELGVSFAVAAGLTTDRGFPTPVAHFGRAPVWLRADVEAHLDSRPLPARRPNELQDELVDSASLADYLGYSLKSFRRFAARSPTFPPPAARAHARNVWLRADVEAWLDEDARRRDMRERRLARRSDAR